MQDKEKDEEADGSGDDALLEVETEEGEASLGSAKGVNPKQARTGTKAGGSSSKSSIPKASNGATGAAAKATAQHGTKRKSQSGCVGMQQAGGQAGDGAPVAPKPKRPRYPAPPRVFPHPTAAAAGGGAITAAAGWGSTGAATVGAEGGATAVAATGAAGESGVRAGGMGAAD
eukprot:scaffold138812_cov21-Tisochrysis_lutea.AAC.1